MRMVVCTVALLHCCSKNEIVVSKFICFPKERKRKIPVARKMTTSTSRIKSKCCRRCWMELEIKYKYNRVVLQYLYPVHRSAKIVCINLEKWLFRIPLPIQGFKSKSIGCKHNLHFPNYSSLQFYQHRIYSVPLLMIDPCPWLILLPFCRGLGGGQECRWVKLYTLYFGITMRQKKCNDRALLSHLSCTPAKSYSNKTDWI